MTIKKPGNGKTRASTSQTKKPRAATTKKKVQASSTTTTKDADIVAEPTKPQSAFPSSETLQGDIAKRAYEIYERRGWSHGQDLSDWLTAEQEILAQQTLIGSSVK